MTTPLSHRTRRIASGLFMGIGVLLSAWLASIPGQAEDSSLDQLNNVRKPITCTDAAGIIYERGTPGFERCLTEMSQIEPEQAAREAEPQAAKKLMKKHKRKSAGVSSTPTPIPTEKTE